MRSRGRRLPACAGDSSFLPGLPRPPLFVDCCPATGFRILLSRRLGPHQSREAPARPVVEVFAPVESRNYLIEAEPAATIHLPNRPPVRLMRFLWVDDVLCRSENGDAALEFTQTREQWVPVSAVIY